MSFDPEFPGLLAAISKIYTGEKLFWLRLLLYDHCSGDLLRKPKITGHNLFNQLKARGYISYEPKDASRTDVEMLVDIAEVTKETRALQIIQKFKQKHKNKNSNYNFRKGKPISEYRKNLFKALHSNTTDLLSDMPGHYDQNPADFNNKWDLVFKLEGSKDLEEGNIGKMEYFAQLLDEDARQTFLQTQNASASKGIRKRKRSTTSEEADEDDNSGHSSDDSRQASTAKQKRKGAAPKGTCKRKTIVNLEEFDRELTSDDSDAGSDDKPSTVEQRKKGPIKSGTKSKDEKKQIMISYKHNHTKVTVKTIVQVLEEKLKESHTFWIDDQDITGNMMEDIERGITGSNIVLICLSKEYEKSKYCKKECQIIREEKIPFVPLRMEDYEPEKDSEVQELVKRKRYIDFSDDTMFTDKNYNKLVQCIKENEKN